MSLAAYVFLFDFGILQPVRWWNKSIFSTSAVSCGHLGVACMYLVHTPSTNCKSKPLFPISIAPAQTVLHPGTDSQTTAIFIWHWTIFVKSVAQKLSSVLAQHWPFCFSLTVSLSAWGCSACSSLPHTHIANHPDSTYTLVNTSRSSLTLSLDLKSLLLFLVLLLVPAEW